MYIVDRINLHMQVLLSVPKIIIRQMWIEVHCDFLPGVHATIFVLFVLL